MTTEEKTQAQNAFINGHTSIMVATGAFGTGIDQAGKVYTKSFFVFICFQPTDL